MDKIKKILKIEYLPIIAFSIIVFLLNKCPMAEDDMVYKDIYYNLSSFFDWARDFYMVWSGRIGIFIITHFFLNHNLILFKIANTLIFDIIVLAMYYIIKQITHIELTSNKKFFLYTGICSLILIIDYAVLSSGAFWVTGAFNYLWPFAFMLISIIPFIWQWKNKMGHNKAYILFIISNLISCFSEQCSAILLVFGIITFIYAFIMKYKINKLLIIHFIIILIITMFSLLAPGNQARLQSETIKWYPNFEMLSLGDKILQGYIVTINHIFNNMKVILVCLTGLLFYNFIKNKEEKATIKIISFIPLGYMLLNIIPFNSMLEKIYPSIDIDGFINNALFTFNRFDELYLYNIKTYVPITIATIVFLLISVLILYSFKDIKEGFLSFLLFFAGIGSAMSISLSPTVYASGNRIFLVTDFMIILITALIYTKNYNENEYKLKKVLTFAIAICSLFVAIQNLLYAGSGIVY